MARWYLNIEAVDMNIMVNYSEICSRELTEVDFGSLEVIHWGFFVI